MEREWGCRGGGGGGGWVDIAVDVVAVVTGGNRLNQKTMQTFETIPGPFFFCYFLRF